MKFGFSSFPYASMQGENVPPFMYQSGMFPNPMANQNLYRYNPMDYQNFSFFMRPGANFNRQQMLELAKQNNPLFFNMNMQKSIENQIKRINIIVFGS